MTNFEFYRDWETAHNAWSNGENCQCSNIEFSKWLYMEHKPFSEKTVYSSKLFDVVEKKDLTGQFKLSPIITVNSRDWVTVIAAREGKLLMEKQFRFGLSKECEEFPSGIVEDDDSSFAFAAHRELLEETGIDVNENNLVNLGTFAANPAFMSNRMHYFYVNLDCTKFTQVEPQPDQNERIDFYWKDQQLVLCDFFCHGGSVFIAGAYFLLWKHGLIDSSGNFADVKTNIELPNILQDVVTEEFCDWDDIDDRYEP